MTGRVWRIFFRIFFLLPICLLSTFKVPHTFFQTFTINFTNKAPCFWIFKNKIKLLGFHQKISDKFSLWTNTVNSIPSTPLTSVKNISHVWKLVFTSLESSKTLLMLTKSGTVHFHLIYSNLQLKTNDYFSLKKFVRFKNFSSG